MVNATIENNVGGVSPSRQIVSTPLSLSDCLQGLQLLLSHTMTNTDEHENY